MNLVHCTEVFSQEYGLIFSLFLAGLVGSFTHCVGMCAPFVLAQHASTEQKTSQISLKRLSGKLLLPYHIGRISTYILLAVLFHSVLNLAFLYGGLKVAISALLLSLAAVIFLISVIPAAQQIFPWAARLSVPLPIRVLSKISAKLLKNPGIFKRYALGVLLGFMPCGLVIAGIMAASTAPSITHAALAMGAFGLGTIPGLLAVSFGGNAMQVRFPKTKQWIKPVAGTISAVWLFLLAGWMMI